MFQFQLVSTENSFERGSIPSPPTMDTEPSEQKGRNSALTFLVPRMLLLKFTSTESLTLVRAAGTSFF